MFDEALQDSFRPHVALDGAGLASVEFDPAFVEAACSALKIDGDQVRTAHRLAADDLWRVGLLTSGE
jgi:hypothetical protein